MTGYVVLPGFISSGITLESGDSLSVLSGAVATDITINSGAFESDYGTAIGTTVNPGGLDIVFNSASSTDTTVNFGGTDYIEGVASGVTINSGGYTVVVTGGTTFSATINSGGVQEVVYGGAANDTVIGDGGIEFVSGVADSHAVVKSGGTLVVTPGSDIVSVSVQRGGSVVSTGVVLGAPGSGIRILGAAGSASLVGNGGVEYVLPLGTAISTILGDGASAYIYSRGTTELMSIESGATTLLALGALASDTIIASGGVDDVRGTASGSVVSGGFLDVEFTGVVSGTILRGGSEQVQYGGTAFGTVVSSGRQVVGSLGTAISTSVSSGGVQFLSGSEKTVGTIVDSGGVEFATPGAVVGDTTVADGGVLIVTPGAVASGLTLLSGGTVVSTGVVINQPASGIRVYGSISTDALVTSAETEYVLPGGTALGTVLSGATAPGTTFEISAIAEVYAGGTTDGAIISSGGTEIVCSGGEAETTTITGGTLDLMVGAIAAAGIAFTPNNNLNAGTLEIEGTTMPTTAISGLGGGNSIWLYNVASDGAGSAILNSATDVLTVTDGGNAYNLQLAGNYTGASFGIEANEFQYPGSVIVAAVPCFAAGTRLLTANGKVAVEELKVGDLVQAENGSLSPIIWIGSRCVNCARHPSPKAVWPVQVEAHAFGHNQPRRRLRLSPDHAIYAEGVLIPVKYLMNGITIHQVAVDAVTYFHVEMPSHSVIFAEDLATESYLDTGDRIAFANGGGQIALHASWGIESRDIAMMIDALGYAPLRVAGPEVDRVRAIVMSEIAKDARLLAKHA